MHKLIDAKAKYRFLGVYIIYLGGNAWAKVEIGINVEFKDHKSQSWTQTIVSKDSFCA